MNNNVIWALTIDIDMNSYVAGENIDEMDLAFDTIQKLLTHYPFIKTTWFVRIDNQLEQIYGNASYIMDHHRPKIEWLLENGHEIGWHLHSFMKQNGKWNANRNEAEILGEIHKYAPVAKRSGMKAVRMGWGYHTNKTMQAFNILGFRIDATAIPRPKYPWDTLENDWSSTQCLPYYPSKQDYRVQGSDNLSILEIPMTTTPIPLPTDTQPGVVRYMNPAYHHPIFSKAADSVVENGLVVLIMHPYEILKNGLRHGLLSFDSEDLKLNCEYMAKTSGKFASLSEVGAWYGIHS